MRRLIHAVAVTACVATCAQAEVRLRAGARGALQVVASTHGPWSPVGRVDALTLNPAGDLQGDGMPMSAPLGDAVLVAWLSPREVGVRMALGREAWRELPTLGVAAAASTPIVRPAADGWVIAWTEGQQVRAMVVRRDGVPSGVADIDDGSLLALTVGGGVAHLLIRASDGSAFVTSRWIPEPDPTPVIFATIGTWQLRDLARVPPSADPTAPWPALHDLGDGRSALTWWLTPTSLAVVALGEDGPDGEATIVTAPGRGNAYPDALARQALRDLARP